MKQRLWIAAAAVLLVIGVAYFWPKGPKIDGKFIEGCRGELSAQNAKFLGRTPMAATYELILTDSRGEVMSAMYRLPVAERKVPVVLVVSDSASAQAWSASLEDIPRINDTAVLGISAGELGDVNKKSWADQLQRKVRTAGLALQYVHQHFAIDTNRIAVIGLDRYSLIAAAIGAHYPESVSSVHVRGELPTGKGVAAKYAKWVSDHAHRNMVRFTATGSDEALADVIAKEAGPPLPVDTTRASMDVKRLKMR